MRRGLPTALPGVTEGLISCPGNPGGDLRPGPWLGRETCHHTEFRALAPVLVVNGYESSDMGNMVRYRVPNKIISAGANWRNALADRTNFVTPRGRRFAG